MTKRLIRKDTPHAPRGWQRQHAIWLCDFPTICPEWLPMDNHGQPRLMILRWSEGPILTKVQKTVDAISSTHLCLSILHQSIKFSPNRNILTFMTFEG